MILDSSLNQSVFILVISFVIAIGYNTIRSDSLDFIYIRSEGAGVSKQDSLLAHDTVLIEPTMIDRELAKKMYDLGILFVDARETEEYNESHITGAILVPSVSGDLTKAGWVLWPIFGATNQMLASLILMMLSIYFWRLDKPVLPLIIPFIFFYSTFYFNHFWFLTIFFDCFY